MRHRPHTTGAAVVLADLAALLTLRRYPLELWHRGTQVRAWLAADGADAAAGTLTGAAIWAIAAWLAVGTTAVWSARMPGLMGTVAERASRIMVPRAVRLVLTGGAGLGVLLTPVAAGATPTPDGSLPAPRWPVAASTSAPSAPSSVLPAPLWPSARRSSPDVPGQTSPPTSMKPSRSGSTSSTPSNGRRGKADVVTVHAGDSFWMLAAHRLSARNGDHVDAAGVAAEWPRWYQANRAVVGNDPDLLLPGQVLHAPAAERAISPPPPGIP